MKSATQSLSSSSKTVPVWVDYLLLALFGFISSILAFFSYFYSDDFWHLLVNGNKFIVSNSSPFSLEVQSVSNFALYRPTTNIFFGLLEKSFGLNPLPYHVVQVGLFVATVLLVRYLALMVLKERSLANLASFIFVILPARVEPAMWLANICDTLLVLFGLASVILLIKFLENREKEKAAWLFLGSILTFGLALLSKEPAVILPVVMGLYVLLFFTRSKWSYFWLGIYSLPLVPYFLMRKIYSINYPQTGAGGYKAPGFSAASINLDLINVKFFIFRTFSIGLDPIQIRLRFFLLVTALILFLAVAVMVFLIRRKSFQKDDLKLILWLTVFYGLSLAPVLSAPNYFDRYLYFGSISLAIIFVLLGSRLYRELPRYLGYLFVSLAVIIIGYWSAQTVSQQYLEYQGSIIAKNFVSALVEIKGTRAIRVINVPFYYDKTVIPGYRQRALVINRADYVYNLYSGGLFAVDEIANVIYSPSPSFQFERIGNKLDFIAQDQGLSIMSPNPRTLSLMVGSYLTKGLVGSIIFPNNGPYYIYQNGTLVKTESQ